MADPCRDSTGTHHQRMNTRHQTVRTTDQRSTTDQMADVIALATKAGMYDAADWIRQAYPWPRTSTNRPDGPESTGQ